MEVGYGEAALDNTTPVPSSFVQQRRPNSTKIRWKEAHFGLVEILP